MGAKVNQQVRRAEVWLANLEPVRGHEQGGLRPCVVVSTDYLNHGPSGLATVVPATTRGKAVPTWIEVGEADGLRERSHLICEQLRTISRERLIKRWGSLPADKMVQVEQQLRWLLGL